MIRLRNYRMISTVALMGLLTGVCLNIVLFSCQKQKKNAGTPQKEQAVMYNCPMHPTYISPKPGKCPICGMDLMPMHQNDDGHKDTEKGSSTSAIKIDPTVIQNIGVQTELVKMRPLQREIRTTATIQADERKIYTVATKIMGYIDKLYVNYTGQVVQKGQPLYTVYSPDLITAQEEYLRTWKSLQTASQSGISAAELSAILQSSRKRLMNWDIAEQEIKKLETRGSVERTLTFYSPYTGIVTEKNAVEGQAIELGMKLYTIIDYSDVWVIFSLYQQDISFVRVGQRAEVDIDFYQGTVFKGAVTYLSPQLDAQSRTVPGRIELRNTADLKLKPGMFATVRLLSNTRRVSVLSIPEQAVIHSGKRTIVILSKGSGYFEPRDVETGISAEGFLEIKRGLNEGDVVVVSSQFLIDSESNLRAAVMNMRLQAAGDSAAPVDSSREKQQAPSGPIPVDHDIYTCPMHPEVVSDKPGDCPKCGMHLVLKKKAASTAKPHKSSGKKPVYTCTICTEILTDKPGECPKCGMKLVPFSADVKGAGGNTGTAQQKASYICTMCPEIASDKPGDCPKCGMALEPKKK